MNWPAMQAHPTADRALAERRSIAVEWSMVAYAVAAGVIFAGFLFVLPFVGLVAGAAVGVDMTVAP